MYGSVDVVQSLLCMDAHTTHIIPSDMFVIAVRRIGGESIPILVLCCARTGLMADPIESKGLVSPYHSHIRNGKALLYHTP